jgi:RNA polymerase primary sigma factor
VELGWPPQDVVGLQDTGQVMVRLHESLSEEGRRLEETLEDQQSPDPYAVVAQRELQQRMAECLSDLPEREAHILRLRFGLDTDRPQTLSEIGDLYGLSRERIRQLETLALKKLRGSIPKPALSRCNPRKNPLPSAGCMTIG